MAVTEGYTRDFDIMTGRALENGHRRNIVEFLSHPIENIAKSMNAGRPIYDDCVMIRIVIPGDNKMIVERKATEEDKITYAREWEAYKKQEVIVADGTPLEQVAWLNRAQVRELRHFSIYTLEMLANLSDDQIASIGMLGMRTIRAKARAHIESAKTGAAPVALVEKTESLTRDNDLLKKQIADLSAKLEHYMRLAGDDPTRHTMAASPPSAPASQPAPAVTPVTAGKKKEIPSDFRGIPDKDLFAMCERITGFRPARRAEAIEALTEARDK